MMPELACGVLSLGDEPGLVEAVRSLAAQVPRPDLVVVNSGGGDPEPRLRASGLDAPVVNVAERLLPGGARNVAIESTRAPFVAFLAGDCVAKSGWVAGRLRRHRAGAAAVASVLDVEPSATRSECAAHLLLHHRRMADTPPGQRLYFGLSYERSLFHTLGRFRDDLRQGEDSEFNRRLRPEDIEWAADVVTVHRHVARPWPLLRDQYARGRRRALALVALAPADARRAVLGHGPANVSAALRRARQTADPAQRDLLLRSRPLLGPAALAYVAGGMAALREARAGGSTPALSPAGRPS